MREKLEFACPSCGSRTVSETDVENGRLTEQIEIHCSVCGTKVIASDKEKDNRPIKRVSIIGKPIIQGLGEKKTKYADMPMGKVTRMED